MFHSQAKELPELTPWSPTGPIQLYGLKWLAAMEFKFADGSSFHYSEQVNMIRIGHLEVATFNSQLFARLREVVNDVGSNELRLPLVPDAEKRGL